MADTAAHMSHNLTTAEVHYEASWAVELTSRACQRFRQILCLANPELAATSGLLGPDASTGNDASSSDESTDSDLSHTDFEPEDQVTVDLFVGVNIQDVVAAVMSEGSRADVELSNRGVDLVHQPMKRKVHSDDDFDTTARWQGDKLAMGRHHPQHVQTARFHVILTTAALMSRRVPSLHRAGNRGNRCMGERDVVLLATANYRAVLVHSYGCVSADRIVCQLREAGGDFSKLADKYESLVNGRRILADRVRLMIKETRKQKRLPLTKFARFKSAPDEPGGSDQNG